MSSSCSARTRRTMSRWPRWKGWNLPMNRGRSDTADHLLGDRTSDGRSIEEGGFWHNRGELRQEALLLRSHEGVLEAVLERLHGAPLDLPNVPVLEDAVLHVRLRDRDLPDPHLRGRLDLGGDAADGQDLPADAQRTGHRHGLVALDLLERADDRGRDADRRGVALRALAAADELDVDVVVRDVLARVLLDERGDVLHGLLRDLPQPSSRDDLPAVLRLRGGDLGRDRQHDARELREAVVRDEDREAVHDPDDGALRDERLVLLAPLDHAVRDLLLEGPRDLLRADDVVRGDEGRAVFDRHVPRDADEPAELAEAERELPPPARAPLSLAEDLRDRHAVEVRDLLVLRDLLRGA